MGQRESWTKEERREIGEAVVKSPFANYKLSNEF